MFTAPWNVIACDFSTVLQDKTKDEFQGINNQINTNWLSLDM